SSTTPSAVRATGSHPPTGWTSGGTGRARGRAGRVPRWSAATRTPCPGATPTATPRGWASGATSASPDRPWNCTCAHGSTRPVPPSGLALLGAGWLFIGVALRRRGRGGLGWLTIVLAVLALLGALDRGVFALPFVPFPPSVPRVLLEFVWVPWALVAALRG